MLRAELAKAVGKTTTLRLHWKSWKKELPPANVTIYIVLKLSDGYIPVTGKFRHEIFPAIGPFKKSEWKTVYFDDPYFSTIILGGKGNEKLIAWAIPEIVGKELTTIRKFNQSFKVFEIIDYGIEIKELPNFVGMAVHFSDY
jgi:hypothetical protein